MQSTRSTPELHPPQLKNLFAEAGFDPATSWL
jgi:hypothetical protein